MTANNKKKDETNNERQARRRKREKVWLRENGWRSWEALHTALMNKLVSIKSADSNSRKSKSNS